MSIQKTFTIPFFLALSLSSGLSLSHAQAAEENWESLGVIDGVSVSRMEVPGQPLFAFRGEMVAPIHIGKLMSVFADSTKRKDWVDRWKDHASLKRPHAWAETYWIRFGLPFPISDRDYVLHSEVNRDPSKRMVTATIQSVTEDSKPPLECCVRARVEKTFYSFEAVPGKEETHVRVEVRTDPKGLLPHWLINLIQKKWPSKTLGGLLEASQKHNQIHPEFEEWHATQR